MRQGYYLTILLVLLASCTTPSIYNSYVEKQHNECLSKQYHWFNWIANIPQYCYPDNKTMQSGFIPSEIVMQNKIDGVYYLTCGSAYDPDTIKRRVVQVVNPYNCSIMTETQFNRKLAKMLIDNERQWNNSYR